MITNASSDTMPPDRTWPEMREELVRLCGLYYPDAVPEVEERHFRCKFKTRIFMIHHSLQKFSKDWGDAVETPGPQEGGLYLEVAPHKGKYWLPLKKPQIINRCYFFECLLAPYSPKGDCHFSTVLRYRDDTDKEFLKSVQELLGPFEAERNRGVSFR